MSNEFANMQGLPVGFEYKWAETGANGNEAMEWQAGLPTPIVPSGFKFVPLYLYVGGNSAVVSGTIRFRVAASQVVLGNGPDITFGADELQKTAVARLGESDSIPAGSGIDVSFLAASLSPTDTTYVAYLAGVFLPA